jgi:hypothetical protein
MWMMVVLAVTIVSVLMGAGLLSGCAVQHGWINFNVVVAAKHPAVIPQFTVVTPLGTPVNFEGAKDSGPNDEVPYVVRKGDTLWSIAAKKKVYGDPFMWPVLWKENVVVITDPNVIEPGLVLTVYRHADIFSVRQFSARWDEWESGQHVTGHLP